MHMMRPDWQEVSTFLIDPQSGAEMARLIDQQKMVTEYIGGLFPQKVDTSKIQSVLDLACGPGSWVRDVAFSHQDMEVIGVDISQAMLNFARSMTRVQGLDNAFYEFMDIRKPLNFDEDSFDFIQTPFLVTALSAEEWPGLLAECKRILRPGGIIRLIEAEWPLTNSSAVQQLGRIVIQALRRIGRSYSPDGQHLGAMAVLVPLLRDAGLTQVQSQTYEIPFTTGLVSLHPIMDLLRTALYLMEPSLLKHGLTTSEEFEALLRQMEFEAIGESFRGMLCIGEAWGEKGS
jgi:ubiquinone/menaquinone biosynthesis C-methylase UbiE